METQEVKPPALGCTAWLWIQIAGLCSSSVFFGALFFVCLCVCGRGFFQAPIPMLGVNNTGPSFQMLGD